MLFTIYYSTTQLQFMPFCIRNVSFFVSACQVTIITALTIGSGIFSLQKLSGAVWQWSVGSGACEAGSTWRIIPGIVTVDG